jgi:PKD repeat protein
VKLTIKTDSSSLSDSAKINVVPSATADFTVAVNKMNVNITNNSLNASSVKWTWGDNYMGFQSDKTFSRKYADTGTYVITLMAYGQNGCNDTMMRTVHIDGITGIDRPEPKVVSMALFPNPVTNILNIQMRLNDNAQLRLTMYDITGRKIGLLTNQNVYSGDNTISVHLPGVTKGIYLLQADVDGAIYNLRVEKE